MLVQWLPMIWTKINCSALTHQIPRISFEILHLTILNPETPKYKEASHITVISTGQKATPTHPERSVETINVMQEDQPSLTAQKGQDGKVMLTELKTMLQVKVSNQWCSQVTGNVCTTEGMDQTYSWFGPQQCQ